MKKFIDLNKGDTIGICSPSGPFTKKEIQPAINYLSSLGFKVKLSKNIHARDRYLAGSPENRANDFHQLISDKSVKTIFAGRGGFGSMQLLPLLDFDLIKKNKKIIFGFSDTTALQWALFKKTNLPIITGIALCPDIKEDFFHPKTKKSFEDIIHHQKFPAIKLKSESQTKNAEGILIGGCLTLIVSLMGTPYFPNLKNKILFIEDVCEEPYSVDRLLSQLIMEKSFAQLSAIVMGKFYKCTAENKKHGTINQSLSSFIKRSPVPVFSNLPYGHQPDRLLLPIGLPAKINNNQLVINP